MLTGHLHGLKFCPSKWEQLLMHVRIPETGNRSTPLTTIASDNQTGSRAPESANTPRNLVLTGLQLATEVNFLSLSLLEIP